MSRETSPYIVGEYWLDKRRDGKSDFWQITTYHAASRSERYRSTKCRGLEDAKAVIHVYVEEQRAKRPQNVEDAKVIPLLLAAWAESGKKVVSPEQIASSLRCFIGFLMQDMATPDVTVAQLNQQLFERFRVWRMGEHSYDVPWAGKDYKHKSKGVRGETVQRNLEDIRSALNFHADNGRLAFVPKVASLAGKYRSPPKDRVLSTEELGAMVGYSAHNPDLHRYILLMLATAVRPEAGNMFDPSLQWSGALIDLHPPEWERTKKVNPVLPVIPELVPILKAWAKDGATKVKSRKTAWRTMRRALGLSDDVEAKTIRHTVATRLRTMGVPAEEVETLLGHRVLKKTTAVYAKYDPAYLKRTRVALSKIFREVSAAAQKWTASHSLSKVGNNRRLVVALKDEEG
jgi:integrase